MYGAFDLADEDVLQARGLPVIPAETRPRPKPKRGRDDGRRIHSVFSDCEDEEQGGDSKVFVAHSGDTSSSSSSSGSGSDSDDENRRKRHRPSLLPPLQPVLNPNELLGLRRTEDNDDRHLSNGELNAMFGENKAAPMPPANDYIDVEMVPCQMEEDTWREHGFPQQNPPPGEEWYPWEPNWCFMCYASSYANQYANHPEYLNLKKMVDDHYGKLDVRVLCAQIQEKYNQTVRRHVKPRPRDWSLQSILDHIEKHAPSPYVLTMRSVRVVTKAMSELEQAGIFARGRNNPRCRGIDEKKLKTWMSLSKWRQTLLHQVNQLAPSTTAL